MQKSIPGRKESIMSSINSFGGVFLQAQDPAKLAGWYTQHFGLEFSLDGDLYWMEFFYRNDDDPSLRQNTVFSIMPAQQPLGDERREYIINYRVNDLAGLLEHLHAHGVALQPVKEQLDGRFPGSKGLFTTIRDLEGNQLELYQPI